MYTLRNSSSFCEHWSRHCIRLPAYLKQLHAKLFFLFFFSFRQSCHFSTALSCSCIATSLTSLYIWTIRFLLIFHHLSVLSLLLSLSSFLSFTYLSVSECLWIYILLSHCARLCRAGYLPQSIPLQIICYLSEEDEFLPWHAASRALYQLDKLLDRTKDYSIFSVSDPPLAMWNFTTDPGSTA